VARRIDETGNRYGRLLVLRGEYKGLKDGKRYLHWRCLCDCGNFTTVRGGHLRDGKVVSCGCYNIEAASKRATGRPKTKRELILLREANKIDEVGNRYGRLVVISEAKKHRKLRDVYWRVRCDCGNEKVVCGAKLRCGATTSCGCYMRERVRDSKLGKKLSEKTREKISNSMRGNQNRRAKINRGA